MRKDSILKLLPMLNSKPTHSQNRDGWVNASCVFAPYLHEGGVDKSPSFGISYGKNNLSRYNCFSCNSSGYLDNILYALRDVSGDKKLSKKYDIVNALKMIDDEDDISASIVSYAQSIAECDSGDVVVFSEEWLEGFKSYKGSPRAVAYLKSRFVGAKVADYLDIRFDAGRDRVCFPSRDFEGDLVGLRGRDISGGHKIPYLAYKWDGHYNKTTWLGEDKIDLDKPVLLVESVFDLASALRVYSNVLCSYSCGVSKEQVMRVAGAVYFVTLYDTGKGGDIARKKLEKHLGHRTVNLLPTAGKGDPGEMTVEELWTTLGDNLDLNMSITRG